MAELQREEIVARIKQARKEAGLTQEELAALLDVIPRTYQNYESTRVPWGFINQIAKATGKTPEWLLHGDPKPTPDLMGSLSGNRAQLDRLEAKLDALAEAFSLLLEAADTPGPSGELGRRLQDALTSRRDRAQRDSPKAPGSPGGIDGS